MRSTAAPLIVTGLDRMSPSSTAVDMIVRNIRYTLAVVFELSPDLANRPCQFLTSPGLIALSSARPNCPRM